MKTANVEEIEGLPRLLRDLERDREPIRLILDGREVGMILPPALGGKRLFVPDQFADEARIVGDLNEPLFG